MLVLYNIRFINSLNYNSAIAIKLLYRLKENKSQVYHVNNYNTISACDLGTFFQL